MQKLLLKTASAALLLTIGASAYGNPVANLVQSTIETALAKFRVDNNIDPGVQLTDSKTAAADVQSLALLPKEPQAIMRVILETFAADSPRRLNTLSPVEARLEPDIGQAAAKIADSLAIGPDRIGGVINFDNMQVASGTLKSRVYVPVGLGPFPLILYIHGGGWVVGNLDTGDASARALCIGTNAVVVAIDYRKAPEFKFPAAYEDCLGAYQWMLTNAEKIRGDRTKVAVAGEGAGGTMAVAVSMMARERGLPMPRHQVLIYPIADLTNFNKSSYLEYAEARPLSREEMMWFSQELLNRPEDARDPRISPALAPTDKLRGLPPTTIINAQIDPLKSDGDRLTVALTVARVKVNHAVYEGVTHGFFGLGSLLAQSQYATDLAAADINASFGRTMPGAL